VTSDPNIGRILSNRYQLVELLGQGAMGRVYRAKDQLLGGVPVAIKFLAQTLLNQKMRDRFEREATTCALLGQRIIHIVRVTDYGVDDNEIPYYVMELLEGESLNEIITQQSISLPRFLSLSRQICLGLQCAHQGIPIEREICPIVHRDVKPSNILVCQDPSLGELVKVLDFGIAKILQAESDQTNCFMGTLAYSSPEQMEGKELDGRSDIYSLGIMMFQMLTGKMPLYADTHTYGSWYRTHHYQAPRSFEEANSESRIPKVLEGLIMSCLSKAPNERPQSIADILKALEPLEQRYGTGLRVGQRIQAALKNLPITTTPQKLSHLSPEEVCRFASWPLNKPIAEIVFSKPLQTTKELLATLWVMLRYEEISKRMSCTRYNQFLFMPYPHPLLLWITALYNREHGARFLPCYLDLKNPQGQQMARLLGQAGQFRILQFPKEEPKRCANVFTSSIAPAQCKLLLDWATTAQISNPSSSQLNLAKTHLKAELEKLKPKILMKLESLYDDGADLSG
jgi:eukaryotic-like serine/threonine-protein kinase